MDLYSKEEQVRLGVDSYNWIKGAGKESREHMFADSVINDYSDQSVSIFYVGVLLNRLGLHDGEVVVNDLPTLIEDNHHFNSDNRLLHPEQFMTMGEAIAAIALIDDESPGGRFSGSTNPALRLTAAAVTRDPELLEFLSFDPCVLVRTAVAVNDFTSKDTLSRLRRDPFWHVQRRTYYGDSDFLKEFDETRKLIDSGEIDPEQPDFWPVDCACIEEENSYEEFNEVFQEDEGLFVPNLPEGLAEKMREYDSWYWGTQPFPEPKSDYMLESIDYLKGKIPDQYGFNHCGHGVNSYSLNFRFAIGELAIISQVGWYGVYNDSQQRRDAWDKMAREIDELIQGKPRIFSPEFRVRDYLIVFSDFRLNQPELWVRNGTEWSSVESIQTLGDIAKIVNKS